MILPSTVSLAQYIQNVELAKTLCSHQTGFKLHLATVDQKFSLLVGKGINFFVIYIC